MINANPRRPPLFQSELFVPTWLFPEEYILGSLAALDDTILQSIDLGRFFLSLREHELEESTL
jgi:hypothetical protein